MAHMHPVSDRPWRWWRAWRWWAWRWRATGNQREVLGIPTTALVALYITQYCVQQAQHWLMMVLDQHMAAHKSHATPSGMAHLGGGGLGGGGLQAPKKGLS